MHENMLVNWFTLKIKTSRIDIRSSECCINSKMQLCTPATDRYIDHINCWPVGHTHTHTHTHTKYHQVLG